MIINNQFGNLMIAYTHVPGIDEPVALTIDNSTYFYIPDIQGSIRAIIDMDGNVVASYQYDAWGNIISYNGTLAEKNDYLYTGREYDWQAGIYYYRARYYNPELGRFLSQDPAGMVDGPNMYIYVKNDPVNGVDPWGKWGYSGCIYTCAQWAYRPQLVWVLDEAGFYSCTGNSAAQIVAAAVVIGISCSNAASFASCVWAAAGNEIGAQLLLALICLILNTHPQWVWGWVCVQAVFACGIISPTPTPQPQSSSTLLPRNRDLIISRGGWII